LFTAVSIIPKTNPNSLHKIKIRKKSIIFNMSLQGKNIIITGATSGLGVQMAATLSSEGATVFIGGRRADSGSQVAEDTNSTFHVVDVADEESNKAFFATAEMHFDGQGADLIILNAGVEGNGEETIAPNANAIKTYDYVFSINVRGIMIGIQYGMPLLRKGGTFIFTSSVGSVLSFGGNPVYAASKAAVDSLVRCYAAQFAESQDEHVKSLSVVSINPALYASEMADRFFGSDEDVRAGVAKMLNPSQRVGKAEELAPIIRDFIAGKLPYKSGDAIACDADTHFPLEEYFGRLKVGQEGTKVQS
jgi:NAD(P)-dependent dehydrogenase (short-subunit alcohol dehydrogenase family)